MQETINFASSAEEAEGLAIKVALLCAVEEGVQCLLIFSDCQVWTEALHGKDFNLSWDLHSLLQDILGLVRRAYELIDEETGEKCIVWGGVDDDTPVPTKEVVSWKPNTKDSSNRSDRAKGGATDSGDANSVLKRSVGSFAKLKAQKIRAITRKSPRSKQDDAGSDSESSIFDDVSFSGSDFSDSEPENVVQKTNVAVLKNKRIVSRTSKSQYVRDRVGINETTPSSHRSKNFQDNDHRKESSRAYEDEYDMDKQNISIPRASSASLGGWRRSVHSESSTYDSRPMSRERGKLSYVNGFFSKKNFKELGCSEEVIESLKSQNFVRPSHIQAMAFPSVLEEKSCILADQSGSGKTLAYLAPVIQRLRHEELQGLSKSSSGSPRVVVLVPTAELASQVLSNCRSMSKFGVPFRSMVATGGFRQKTQLESLQQDLDVLIATPGRFLYLLKEGFLQLTNLRCAVLDEVDILYGDEDFEQVLQSLVNSAPVTIQYLFVTATLPVDIYNKLVEVFPDCEVIMGPGMHRTSLGLEEVLVDCSGHDDMEKTPETAFVNKKTALLQLAEESPVPKTIIFCNKIETCRKVENVLSRLDRKGSRIRVLPFHSALAQEARLQNMKEFLSPQSDSCQFLICTDRASRGIDFAGVNHVLLFDFPRDPSEYVRRVGRTARGAGGKGKAFVFVVGKQVSLARRIMDRNQKGHPLHDVPSAGYEW
ncbi:Dead-box atp-dependent rna helicase [Thalictrum thalictroides]|uniref:Dead-box atp-dependent rna helicase n=1 Tax=Thalictrum thalictroides TaxID=46969 RepID=A0A7J6W2K9_THATH|nr:Dead-box atp-dependent rna helicase [Thalictrum thalictroides]